MNLYLDFWVTVACGAAAYSAALVVLGVYIGRRDAPSLMASKIEEGEYYKALWEGYQEEVRRKNMVHDYYDLPL